MKTNKITDPFAAWKAALVVNIRAAIKKARRQGVTGMSRDNLRMVTETPQGGPTGTNVAYFYKNDWFPEALAKLDGRDAAFILN